MSDGGDFIRRLGTGREREAFVAYHFIKRGLEVYVPPLKVRPRFSERHAYRDVRDMVVEGQDIEIKSTRYRFTSADDFPFDPAFVDTKEKVEAKGPPLAFVVVCQETHATMVIPGRTYPDWVDVKARDHARNIDVDWLACPLRHMKTLDDLVEHLLSTRSPNQSSSANSHSPQTDSKGGRS